MSGVPAPGRRRAAWIAAALLLALALAAAVAVAARKAIAEWYAVRALAQRGYDASLDVTQLGARGAVIAPLRVAAPGFPSVDADRIELDWSFAGLRAGRVAALRAQGVRVQGELELPGFGAAAGAEAEEEPALRFALPALPVDALQLDDLALEVDTAQGHFSLKGGGAASLAGPELSGEIALAGDTPYGALEAKLALAGTHDAPEARFDVSGKPSGAKVPLAIEAPLHATGSLHGDASGAARWQAALTLPFLELPELARLEEIALEAEGDAKALRGKLRVARAIDVRKPALLAPVSIELDFDGPFEALPFRGRGRTLDGGWTCELRGTFEPFERSARVTFRVPETQVGEKKRQPPRVSPRIGAWVQQAKGFLGATGSARFAKGKLDYQADVAFRELDLRASGATLRGLTGAVTFTGPPLATPPGQLVSIAAIEDPLPLANGLVEFELKPESIALERAVFAAAKGQLSASGLLPLDAAERSIELVAQDLDVTTLLAALPFDALSGTGTLAGTLPLRQRGARVRIENGALRATVPGVIRYRPNAGSEAATKQQSQLGVVFGALEDLHYETLELDISGDTAEELDVAVRVVGRNPNFQDGRPVHLNLNVEARLGDLVKVGQAAYRVPGEVEERVKRILDREKQ